MGMAAGQARLLSITSRLSDNELRAQIINNNKMRLATESAQISEAYIAALNDAQLMFTNYDENNNVNYQQLTYNALTAYNPYNNQYALTNASGNVLLSEKDAQNYRNSADLEDFLACYGLEQSTSYFDNLKGANGAVINSDKDIVYFGQDAYGNLYAQSSGYTAEALKHMYMGSNAIDIGIGPKKSDGTFETVHPNGYVTTLNSNDYYNYVTALNNYYDKRDAYYSLVSDLIKTQLNSNVEAVFGGLPDYGSPKTIDELISKLEGETYSDYDTNDTNTTPVDETKASNLLTNLNKLVSSAYLSDHIYGTNETDFKAKLHIDDYLATEEKQQYDVGAYKLISDGSGGYYVCEKTAHEVYKQVTSTDTSTGTSTTEYQTVVGTYNETKSQWNDPTIPESGVAKYIQYVDVNSETHTLMEYKPIYHITASGTVDTVYDNGYDNSSGNREYNEKAVSSNSYSTKETTDDGKEITTTYTVSNAFAASNTGEYVLQNEKYVHYTASTITYNTDENMNLVRYKKLDNENYEEAADGTYIRIKDTTSYVETYDLELTRTNNLKPSQIKSNALSLLETLKYSISSVWDYNMPAFRILATSGGKVVSSTQQTKIDNAYQAYIDAQKELGKVIYGGEYSELWMANNASDPDTVRDWQISTSTPKYASGDDLCDIATLYNNWLDGSGAAFSKYFIQVYFNILLDNVMDTYGEPKLAWIDKNDSNENGDAKEQWYENLYKLIQENGYAVIQDGLASSSEWIQFAFESGIVSMQQVDELNNWNHLIYSNCSDITSQTNDVAIAKAEAEYNAAMNKIENKDKRYDLELKNIDTEHSSLQTEYESIKTAIDKNIERTFKLYS